jgi:phospholipid transport system substrate-binding protein
MKRPLLSVLLLLPCLLAAGTAAAVSDSPEALVRSTSERMLSELQASKGVLKEHPEKLYSLVSDIVLPHFDFEIMARSVLGKYWHRATPEQRERFVKEFRFLLVRTYASSLADYSDQKVIYRPMRPSADPDQATVRTEIEQKSGFPVPVDYDLERQGGDWKVVNVTIDNLNLVSNYRSSFGVEIRQIGLARTIDKLAERNKQADQ